MKWPWNRKGSSRAKAKMERLEEDALESEVAAIESDHREEMVREVQAEALEVLATSRNMARENHFGEMIDDALGVRRRKHA